MIKDSGSRRDFGGAVRDMGAGKGRFDLIPLDVMATVMNNPMIGYMSMFENDGDIAHLYNAIDVFCTEAYEGNKSIMMMEVAKHFEEGCSKYGERNWQSGDGIPVWCYIDSALRHYVKWLDNWDDESHARAVVWNLMCGIWTYTHMGIVTEAEAAEEDVPEVIEEILVPVEEIDLNGIDDLLPLGD